MDVVFEVWEGGGRDVRGARWREGRADCEDCGYQGGVVQSNAEDDGSAPVVAAEDDVGEGEMGGESGDVVGGTLEGVVSGGVRGVGPGVAHHVGDYDAEFKGEEEGNLTGNC